MFSAVTVVAALLVSQSDIETEYDKFYDYTDYTLKLGRVVEDEDFAGVHTFSVSATHRGKDRKAIADSDTFDLMIMRRGRTWRYLKDHKVIVMEGDNRFVIETNYDSDVGSNAVYEFFHIRVALEEAKNRLKSGKDWEIKIGFSDPLTLGPVARRKIGDFIHYIQKP
jgi:hypothetical protein